MPKATNASPKATILSLNATMSEEPNIFCTHPPVLGMDSDISAINLPASEAILTLSRSSSDNSAIDSEKDFIPPPNEDNFSPKVPIEPMPKKLAIPSITEETVIASIKDAKLPAAIASSGVIALSPAINGRAANMNADNSSPRPTKPPPIKLLIAAITSATVNAITAPARIPTPANTLSSIDLVPTIKGLAYNIKSDKAWPRAGSIVIIEVAMPLMNSPIISPMPPASLIIIDKPLSKNSSSPGHKDIKDPIATAKAAVAIINVSKAAIAVTPTNASGPTNANITHTLAMHINKSLSILAFSDPFCISSADIIASTRPINAITTVNAVNPTAPATMLGPKNPITDNTVATPVITMSKVESTKAFAIAFFIGSAVIIANTRPINAITTTNAANPTAPATILGPKKPIKDNTTATPVNTISNPESTRAFPIAFFIGSAVIIANTRPINAITTTNAANPTAPATILGPKKPIKDNTTATPVNTISNPESTRAFPIAFFTGRTVIITSTKPSNAITLTRASITAAIAPTCLKSIDFELLTMTKATDNASKSVANANTVPILESISN